MNDEKEFQDMEESCKKKIHFAAVGAVSVFLGDQNAFMMPWRSCASALLVSRKRNTNSDCGGGRGSKDDTMTPS